MILIGAFWLCLGIGMLVEAKPPKRGDPGIPIIGGVLVVLAGVALMTYGGWHHDWMPFSD